MLPNCDGDLLYSVGAVGVGRAKDPLVESKAQLEQL
jgi:hypothetical protein